MECKVWSDCMSPEQFTIVMGALVTLIVTIIGAVGFFIHWGTRYFARVQDEKLNDLRQERELEKKEFEAKHETARIEQEIKLREYTARHEAFEKSLMVIAQFSERHAESDERHAENERRNVDVQTRLASAIEALTKSTQTSQSWQEKRAEDYLETVGVITERTSQMSRVGEATLSKVELISSGLEDVKKQLDVIARHNPNKEALERVEREIGNLIILVRDHIPKPPPPVPIQLAEPPPDGVTSVVPETPLQNEALQQTPPKNKDESKEEKS